MFLTPGFQQLVTDSNERNAEASHHEEPKVEGQLVAVVGVEGQILARSAVSV
jgi:hypothetical protein